MLYVPPHAILVISFFFPPLILEPRQTSDPQKNKLQAIFTFKSPEDTSECNIHFFHWNGTFLIATCGYHQEQKYC